MKDIPGYEGLYAITSCGKVWSYKSKKFLAAWKVNNRYLAVTLRKDGQKTNCLVHRLVALTYLSNPDNLPQVNHKDEDITHNWINNLEWCSASYNVNYGKRNEKCSQKMSKPFICEQTGETFNNLKEAQNKLNICLSSISRVLRGEYSQASGYTFKYL